jgi:hypothetical protein
LFQKTESILILLFCVCNYGAKYILAGKKNLSGRQIFLPDTVAVGPKSYFQNPARKNAINIIVIAASPF